MAELVAIFVAPVAGTGVRSAERIEVEAGKGLVGDRYHSGTGTFSRWGGVGGEGRAVSLIEGEVVEAVFRERGIDLRNGEHRRNLVTWGVELGSLVGKVFRVGGVVLRGTRVCTECAYLDRKAGPGTAAALKGRPGLRADVVEGGVVAVGDVIEVVSGAAVKGNRSLG